jgi:F0F1-type ATP synthase membrane subunit a
MVKLLLFSLVVAAITLFLVLGTSNLKGPGILQNAVEVIYELVKVLP